MRRFGFRSLDEVDKITLRDYELLIKAEQLKSVDDDCKTHWLAWLTFQAKAMKKSGKPAYRTFRSFYDYEKELEKVMDKQDNKSKFSALSKAIKQKGGEHDG